MLRLTGGKFRGRMIRVPEEKSNRRETRPTKSQLRQALFNSLQSHLPEARVLDLFSGSGSLGLEALSRGAAHIVFVEDSRPALAALKDNIQSLKVESETRLIARSVDTCFAEIARLGPFDLILADPPYADGWEMKLLEKTPWKEWLTPGGVFALEWGLVKSKFETLPDETGFLIKIREKLYGDSGLTFYEMKP